MSHYLVSTLNICKEMYPTATPCQFLTFSKSAIVIFRGSDLFLPFLELSRMRGCPLLFLPLYTFEKWDHNYKAKPFMQLQVAPSGTPKGFLTKKEISDARQK